jgi:lipid-binding SYLF domain-containing protein
MEGPTMNMQLRNLLVFFLLAIPSAYAFADDYTETINVFRKANESSQFFSKSYGYAVLPTIGKGGIGIGGAHGKGQVYVKGTYVGDTSMTQITVGFQLGGQAYSQIIFFEDKRAFDEFTSGNFEFGAQATAVAITAGASAQAGTTGSSASASGGQLPRISKYCKGGDLHRKGGRCTRAAWGETADGSNKRRSIRS